MGHATGEDDEADSGPVVPEFGRSVADLVPAILEGGADSDLLPEEVLGARAVVLLVLDGLGWQQLASRARLAPTMAAMGGGPLTTVAPSTTATALTSITTGSGPGRHGLVGYRIRIDEVVINALRWTTPAGDARRSIPPRSVQPDDAFLGHRPPVVTKAEFAETGFTLAHLAGTRLCGYRHPSAIPVEIGKLVRAGEPFVYAYYDGLDRVAHENGLGLHYDAELRNCDRLVGDILEELPRGAALVVTADHGLVDCVGGELELDPELLALTADRSGEARFRWLHRDDGVDTARLRGVATELHGHQAWVTTAEEMIDAGWLGPVVTDTARARLGDVALVARGNFAFLDAADTGSTRLIGRHGSLTAAEMLVPGISAVN